MNKCSYDLYVRISSLESSLWIQREWTRFRTYTNTHICNTYTNYIKNKKMKINSHFYLYLAFNIFHFSLKNFQARSLPCGFRATWIITSIASWSRTTSELRDKFKSLVGETRKKKKSYLVSPTHSLTTAHQKTIRKN